MKKNRKSKNLITAFFILLGLQSFAQSTGYVNGVIPKVLQPLPEAASLGKFGNIPVGLFTGVPQISIPIYSIDVNGYSLPISVDYHASGVRVDEISSNVGLGWALNAGGMISCTINDIYDFDATHGLYGLGSVLYTSYKNGGFDRVVNHSVSTTSDPDYILVKGMADGTVDGEPDEFNFSFGGKSGKFVFDETRTPRTVPFEPLKIEFSLSNNSFLITDTKGVKYLFSELESASVDQAPGSTCSSINWFSSINNYTPTWYLSTITSSTGDIITFHYNTVSYSYALSDSETLYDNPIAAGNGCIIAARPENQRCKSIMNVHIGKRLSSITTNKGHVVNFTYSSTSRQDLPGTNSLDAISINYNQQPISIWTLNHDYFVSSTISTSPDNYRLKLTSVQQDSKPPYTFDYNSTVLPLRNSFNQDYWGYYNGANNSTLVPKAQLISGEILDGANREVNSQALQAGTLNKITYPTAGSTEFFYEPNDYFFEGQERNYTALSTPALSLSGQGSRTYSFTTGPHVNGGILTFQTNIPGNSILPPGDQVTVQLQGGSVNQYVENVSATKMLALVPNTTYTLTINSTTDGYQDNGFVQLNATVIVTWSDYTQQAVSKNVFSGGLRVVQTSDKSSITSIPIVKKYIYSNPIDGMKSSGYIVNEPINAFFQTFYQLNASLPHTYDDPCTYTVRTSQSNAALASIKGSSVGYEYVTVLEGSNGENGKTISQFKKYNDLGAHYQYVKNEISGQFPSVYTKTTSYDFLRGLLLKETVYQKTSIDFSKVKQTDYVYQISDDVFSFLPNVPVGVNNKNILGLKAYMIKPETVSPGSGVQSPGFFELLTHYYVSNWYYLSSVQTTDYDPDGVTPLTSLVQYFYDNPAHAQLSRTVKTNSDNKVYTTLNLYPNDYGAGTSFIDDMKSNYLLALPIEQVTYVNDGSSTTVVKGQAMQYVVGGKELIEKYSQAEITTAIPLSNYKFSNNVIGQSHFPSFQQNFLLDDHYKERAFVTYDALGNVKQIMQKDNVPTIYLWGYNKLYPIAEIKNTSYDAVEAVLGGSIAVDNFSNISLPSQTQLSTFLAPLRSAFPNALITTYTYKPLVGMTSQTDAKGMTTYYEYDSFQRLKYVKDQNGNIIKSYDYHFKN